MRYDFTKITVKAVDGCEKKAARLFADELFKRTGKTVETGENTAFPRFTFSCCASEKLKDNDCFIIEQTDDEITVFARTVRGLIYGYSLFLRKCEFDGENINLIKNIGGEYVPEKKTRGHQIGYRTTPNTYDAWDYDQYFRYYLDMMAFGCNTCEHIPYEKLSSERNALMKYDEEEFIVEASRLADEVDMDVSIWHPNCDGETADEAVERRRKLYSKIPRIDVIFPPGGDPGELYADDFVERCEKISKMLKELHPSAEMWPSAQAPHIYPDWGEAFTEELNKEPDGIDGVIMGPNHAYPMHELRKKIPARYPLRFYPDITHNVRCEYPVHFLEDDWHYSLCSALSRECVNPRPQEFSALHRIFSPYTVGSVSYSEGVHDDLNKMVWSDLEFNPETNIRDSILDYARFFMFKADAEKITDGIFGLEKNWDCDPLFNPCIDYTYRLFCELKRDYLFLYENWRFEILYFRACCDRFIRKKRLAETDELNEARFYLSQFDLKKAKEILSAELPAECVSLRAEIEALGKHLFDLIGIQLDVEHYFANSWERGATLETIDNPITDKKWLKNRIAFCEALPEGARNGFVKRLLERNATASDEYYYSVALHGLSALGVRQEGEFYMNFQGDRPNVNNGTIPMSMLKVYDHFTFKAKLGGFSAGCDYILKIAYKTRKNDVVNHHKITANGFTVYDGKQYGGIPDEKFDKELLAPGFESAAYALKSDVFINGTLELEIIEPISGFQICEFWIKKSNNDIL